MNKGVFNNITIVAFSWAMVGPLTMKYFADYGATVIRIETVKHPCTSRTSPPYRDRKPGLNRSGYFNHFSANMYSMTLDMTNPLASGVIKRLIAKADIVAENFTSRVMDNWGLGYEELKKIRHDIIMLRQSGFGVGSPYADLPAFGMTLAAMAGLPNFIGFPGGTPLPVGVGAYTDCINPRFAAAAVIAALDYRDRTGKGQLLDLAQLETSLYFILPAILDRVSNKREPSLKGNSCDYAAPQGVYQCKGDDRWCTIAVFNKSQWEGLCEVIGKPEYIDDPRFVTVLERKKNEGEINRVLDEWTATKTAEEVMRILQEAGVPTGVVENAKDLYSDPQLRERGLFWPIDHSEMKEFTHLGANLNLSRTPAKASKPSPRLGEHTEYVCTKIIGMSDEEFIELMQADLFQ